MNQTSFSKEISLILPAYNTSAYLVDCIESCEAQDIEKSSYEIIIVNDGSSDDTLDVATGLSHKFDNIRILSQHNQGLSMARNNGAAIARGKYLWFIDSDDTIARNCLNTIVKMISDMRLDMFGVGPSIPFKSECPSIIDRNKDVTPVMTGREWSLSGKAFVGAWAYVMNTEFWKKFDFQFYPDLYFEDTELMPKVCFKASKIASFDTFSCYNYIQREGSIMHSEMSVKKILDIARIINSHGEFIESELDADEQMAERFEKGRSASFIAGINEISKKKDRKLLMEFLGMIRRRPYMTYGSNVAEKLYQRVILNFPSLYYSLK